ncbi:uncharacterized protein LOC141857587 [Brevipalpus obovatus]|uniref:uncharacterized protein LOC141857587 n=1 Tax=Brevipalpus obovatus TaxID=246614 RepID=UPI003D9DE26E
MIPKMLDSLPDPATSLILLSAIYFKSKWNESFNTHHTRQQTFTNNDGSKSSVNFMFRKHDKRDSLLLRYRNDDAKGFQMIELPYKNSMSMFIILPHEGKKLKHVLAGLNDLGDFITLANSKPIPLDTLGVPKLKMSREYDMHEFLTMQWDIIYSDKADFSKISDTKMKVSKSIHKVAIEVNEEGTQAAAVTSIQMIKLSASHNPRFIADRPFAFFIIDKSNWLSRYYSEKSSAISSNLLAISNKIKVNPEFGKIADEYVAHILSQDFEQPLEAQKAINSWVAKKTKNKIPKMLSDKPDKKTLMILLNAVYFKELRDAVKILEDEKRKDELGRSRPKKIDSLSIPKFKISKEYDMRAWLKMMWDIIYSDKADFSGISSVKIKVSKSIHKAAIEVNEEGTFAAAATSIESVFFSGKIDPGINFIANRPFAFCIWDKSNWVTLFGGIVQKF